MFTSPRTTKGDKGSRCPKCGSDMVIETEIVQNKTEEDEEGVSLGIPACEMLDLNVMVEADETSSGEILNYSSSPVEATQELVNLGVVCPETSHIITCFIYMLQDLNCCVLNEQYCVTILDYSFILPVKLLLEQSR